MKYMDDLFAKKLNEEAAFPGWEKGWETLSSKMAALPPAFRPSPLRIWQAVSCLAIGALGTYAYQDTQHRKAEAVLLQEMQSLRNTVIDMNHSMLTSAAESKQRIASLETLLQQQQQASPVVGDYRPDYLSDLFVPRVVYAEPQLHNEIAPATLTGNPDVPVAVPPYHPSLDSATVAALISSALSGLPPRDTVYLSPPIEPNIATITPVPSRKPRMNFGIRGTLATPQPKKAGVSNLTGQGVTLETRLAKGLWATLGVDWLHYSVQTPDYDGRFLPAHDTIPQPPFHLFWPSNTNKYNLIQVESEPHLTMFNLGLRYELPIKSWLTPGFHFAHTWTRTDPISVTYQFKKKDFNWPGWPQSTHKPEYTTEKFGAIWVDNQWTLGLSLQKRVANWSFNVTADYLKEYSKTTPAFDAIFWRAGVAYRIW